MTYEATYEPMTMTMTMTVVELQGRRADPP
jgi:hypothetical protein